MTVLRWSAAIVLGVLAFSNLPANAQSVITCSSEDGRRNFCSADVRSGVRLGRQRSGSPCRRNYSWGVQRGGIWVDRGCRADFIIGSTGYRPGRPGPGPVVPVPGPGPGQMVNCSSEDGRRKYCPTDTRRGVTLVKQRSGSPCTRNYSWGYDRGGIWVDRGCRADFQVR